MQLFINRPVAILLLAALLSVFAIRGIWPALSVVDSDFPNYFTAAKIVADGGNTDRMYDTAWFQEQMRRYRIGTAKAGEFVPFPPPTALLLVPLARLTPLNALRMLTCASLLFLVVSIATMARILSWTLTESAVFVLLSGVALINTLRLGQPYVLVSASCILGYYAYTRGRPWLAGACFGIFAPIKYFPVILLIYFAIRREWKVLLGGSAAMLAVGMLSVAVLGWRVHEEFLSSVLGNHLVAKLNLQDPFTASYQSFDSLYRRLFIFDASSNARPWIILPGLEAIFLLATKTSIFLIAIATLVKLGRGGTAHATAPSIGILGILTLLLAPATATYHFVLLWLPIALLTQYFISARAYRYAYFIIGAYSLIGFFPYRLTRPFEGDGGLTVLAYPRLFLLLAMFAACVYFVWRRSQATSALRGAQYDFG